MKNKKTLYLHIGDAKTGSSTIQSKSSIYRKALEEKGVLYSKVGLLADNGVANHKLAFSVNANRPEFHSEKDHLFSCLHEESYYSSCNNLLVSSEGFCSLRTRKEIFDLYNALQGFYVKVIAYVRRPDLWLESWYSQIVKNKPFSRKTFFDYLKNHQEPSLQTIINYGEQFGFNNLIVRPFERKSLFEGDLYKDFLKCLGVYLDLPSSGDANISPDVYVTELFRRLNCSLNLSDVERLALYQKIMNCVKVSDKKHYFDVDGRVQFLDSYDGLLKEFATAFGESSSFFSEFDPKSTEIYSCAAPDLKDVELRLDKFYEFIVSGVEK